jgi:hypothetical protein
MDTTQQAALAVKNGNDGGDATAGGAIALIREAMARQVAPETLRELLAVRREWEADEGRKAFAAAISEFQRRAPIIEKADDAHGKSYARLDRIWRTIRPLLTELGLSVTWQVCELKDGICHVEGQLRHRAGHGERIAQDIPLPEIIRGQNAAQQMGSARSYAQRYALCGALGVVTGEDDDGTAAGTVYVSDGEAREIADLVDACRGVPGFNEAAFWKWCGATMPQDIPANRRNDVLAALRRKLNPEAGK